MLRNLLIFIFIIFSISCWSQQASELRSPDGKIIFYFSINENIPKYQVQYKGKKIIENSSLSLTFDDGPFSDGIIIKSIKRYEGIERYSLLTGKTNEVNEPYKALSINIFQKSNPSRSIILNVRAFNDGVAFRYEFPENSNKDSLILTDEISTFNFPQESKVKALYLPNYTTSHEGLYHNSLLKNIKEDTLIDMPLLVETPEHIFVALTESNLLDYAGMYVTKQNGILQSTLSPLPQRKDIKVIAKLPHKSPWRLLIISDKIEKLIESNLVTNLAEPARITNTDWIRPGKTTFPWWNGNVLPDSINAPGNNFVTQQYYIDFCARNGIEYHSVVEYGLHEWYTSDGIGFVPGPNTDVTKPVPGLDMQQVCDYAKSKGVGIRVWVYWTALYKDLEAALTQFEKWGISGMMVDFMDRDDQEMVNIQTKILERAAAHHIHVQFHGAYKPTGLSRTYPNEFTREGTLNYESNKWNKIMTAEHDINMPFTRMLAGGLDYHLGGFRAVPDSSFKVQYTRPLMLGTRCHMLGLYVVFESALGMVCDYPEAYEGQPGFEFICQVPTRWEKTQVLSAIPDDHIVIARKKDNNWYIGAINNLKSKSLVISYDFLDEGIYEAIIYTDTPESVTNPNKLNKQTIKVSAKDKINIELVEGGGAAMILKKQL